MMGTIRAIFKWALLVLVILALSHIVEIRGVSVSRHVLNALQWVNGFLPGKIVSG
jgi:hypothetical protein